MRRTRGFTLIELLVVIAIMAVLAGLLMPVIGLARKRAAESNTLALLRKVDTGLELFKGELDTYPYQAHDPAAAGFPETDNRLGWILAHDLSVVEHQALRQDLETARQAYAPGGSHHVTEPEVDPRIQKGGEETREMYAGLVNRLATERATLAVLAGNLEVRGIHNDAGSRIVPNPASRGYAFDFLSIDLNPDDLRGETIVDFWGRPLVYVCPVVQGVRGFYPPPTIGKGYWNSISSNEPPILPEHYGLHSLGRALTHDRSSDLRNSAGATWRFRPELWSAGLDGRFAPQRDHADNRDNIAAAGYLEGLR